MTHPQPLRLKLYPRILIELTNHILVTNKLVFHCFSSIRDIHNQQCKLMYCNKKIIVCLYELNERFNNQIAGAVRSISHKKESAVHCSNGASNTKAAMLSAPACSRNYPNIYPDNSYCCN